MHDQDEVQSIGSQRRISIPTRSNIPKHLDTRKPGFLGRSLICPVALPLKNFRLLRVLQGSNKHIFDAAKYSLGDTSKLVNLRFILIRTSNCPKIHSSFCLLWNLQILIVTRIRENTIAPLEIWEMTELRHLEFSWGIYLPDPPPSQQINTQEGDATMKNLQTLKGIIDFRLNDEVVKRIPNIKKLEIYYKLTRKELKEMGLKSLGLLENLESLNLDIKQEIGADLLSYLTFPNSLKKLTFGECGLHWEDMSTIASLPHLEVLILDIYAFKGPEWVLNEEVFCYLKFLLIGCYDLVQWIAEDTHFPCLEHLYLHGLYNLVEIPSSIGDIPTLQKIELYGYSKSIVISTKKILEAQEELGNVSLKVQISCSKRDELESLASDNFLVNAWSD